MKVVVLTGAGISAESGVPTFRDADGLWEGHRVEDVATPGGVRARSRPSCTGSTTPGARRSRPSSPTPPTTRWPGSRSTSATTCCVVTQNIDDLHERGRLPAGAAHARRAALGAVPRLRRAACRGPADLGDFPPCPRLRGERAAPRRRVVRRDPLRDGPDRRRPRRGRPVRLDRHLGRGLPGGRLRAGTPSLHGARTLELNLQPSEGTTLFHEPRHGPAGVLVPEWVDELLGEPAVSAPVQGCGEELFAEPRLSGSAIA